MRIAALNIHNFMAFKGEHFIDFTVEESAPVILFLGENGHGKSTIQHAARWCLYGATDEKGQEIARESLVNRKALNGDPEASMSVSLTWIAEGRTYALRREMRRGADGALLQEPQLRIDGENPVPAASIPEYVQRFLAKDISHFIFFNGEVQQEFDDMATNSGSAEFVRREIEKTLSIPVIAECVSWFQSKATEESTLIFKANKNDAKVAAAQKRRLEAQEVMGKLKEEVNTAQYQKNAAKKSRVEIESKMADLKTAQDLVSEIAILKDNRKSLKVAEADRKDLIRDFVSRNPWLPLGSSLLKRKNEIEKQIAEANASASVIAGLKVELGQLEMLRKSDNCPLCHSNHEVTTEEVAKRINQLEVTRDSLGEVDTSQLERSKRQMQKVGVDESVYASARDAQKALNTASADLAKCEQRLTERNEDLSIHGDVDVQNLLISYRSYSDTEREKSQDVERYRKDITEQESIIKKCDHEVGKAKGVNPQQRRTLAAYEYLTELLGKSLETYTKEVKDQVQAYASETFMDMISDPKYKGLRINNNYGVDLIMKDGDPDPLRSTGQGKIATIALVSGLIKTTMVDGSILMDTPFVSLDEGHRREVCRWAYSSGLWVSLFMHSGEFQMDEHLGFFDGHVGRIYRIRQVDTNESTIEAFNE